jgi:hypothetical protein
MGAVFPCLLFTPRPNSTGAVRRLAGRFVPCRQGRYAKTAPWNAPDVVHVCTVDMGHRQRSRLRWLAPAVATLRFRKPALDPCQPARIAKQAPGYDQKPDQEPRQIRAFPFRLRRFAVQGQADTGAKPARAVSVTCALPAPRASQIAPHHEVPFGANCVSARPFVSRLPSLL